MFNCSITITIEEVVSKLFVLTLGSCFRQSGRTADWISWYKAFLEWPHPGSRVPGQPKGLSTRSTQKRKGKHYYITSKGQQIPAPASQPAIPYATSLSNSLATHTLPTNEPQTTNGSSDVRHLPPNTGPLADVAERRATSQRQEQAQQQQKKNHKYIEFCYDIATNGHATQIVPKLRQHTSSFIALIAARFLYLRRNDPRSNNLHLPFSENRKTFRTVSEHSLWYNRH